MIDGVELRSFDQWHHVGEFQCDGAFRFQRGGQTSSEVVDVRNMGINVVTDNQISSPSLCRQLTSQAFTEEFPPDR